MEAQLRKWGSSLGIVIPKEIVRKEKLKEGDKVDLELKKTNPIMEAFGSMPDLKIDAQKMSDENRKEWY